MVPMDTDWEQLGAYTTLCRHNIAGYGDHFKNGQGGVVPSTECLLSAKIERARTLVQFSRCRAAWKAPRGRRTGLTEETCCEGVVRITSGKARWDATRAVSGPEEVLDSV